MNLVINGAEAMGSETGAVLITASNQDVDQQYIATLSLAQEIGPGTYVVLEVHHTGYGMDEPARGNYRPLVRIRKAVFGIPRGRR
jgi:hypothetical protein